MDDIDDEFCCLCWKSTRGVYPQKTKNALFCSDHLCSGETKKNNYRDTRLLIRGLTNFGHVIPEDLRGARRYQHLSSHLTDLSINPNFVIESGRFVEKSSLMSPQFKIAISRYFPLTFKLVRVCFERRNVDELMLAIFTELSKSSNSNRILNSESEQHPITPPQTHLPTPAKFINMLARYEAYQLLHEKPVKRGPKATSGRDVTLREKIIQIYNQYAAAGQYRCQHRIAEQLGITPARVSVLMTELVKEKKLTKNMTQTTKENKNKS